MLRMWDRLVLAVRELLGYQHYMSSKYRYVNREIYFTMTRHRVEYRRNDALPVAVMANLLADKLEDFLRIGRYETCSILINHFTAQIHNVLMIVVETGGKLTPPEWLKVKDDCMTMQAYMDSLLPVLDPTTIDFEMARCMRNGLNEMLNSIEEYVWNDPDPVDEAQRIINGKV